jgi:MFS transporter, CP family, cyanate transporter
LVLWGTPHVPMGKARTRPRWWPDWRDVRTWQLGLNTGGCGALYFGSNTFLPDYLHAIGRPDLLNAVLTSLNLGQLPASLLIMLFGQRLVGRKVPIIVVTLMGLVGFAGVLVPSAPVIVTAVGIIGFAPSFTLILTLALPPMLVAQDDVHRMAAGMLALGYTITFVVPWLAGAVWDATHLAEAALLPGVIGAMIILGTAAMSRLDHRSCIAQPARL